MEASTTTGSSVCRKLDGAISFNLELFCTLTGHTQHRHISFPESSLPTTVAELKDKIEENFSIPVCVQSLKYEDHLLGDGISLEMMKIRSGDTFCVSYSSEGNCKEIFGTVTWFGVIRESLATAIPSKTNPISADLRDLIYYGYDEELIDDLAYKHLFPWLDPKKYTNRLYFVQSGGLEAMMDIYASLHQNTWKDMVLLLKYLENGIIRVLWNLSETFQLRRQIMSHRDGLGLCMKSLLRQNLEERKAIVDETNPNESDVLMDTIEGALGLLCNLSELPECHLTIASSERCMQQLTCISLTPSTHVISVQLVATIFVCLAYSPSTHPFLANPLLIGRLLDATTSDIVQRSSPVDALMLSYYTQVFLAQVILTSPQYLPTDDLQRRILVFMEDFLKIAMYETLREGEIKHWYVWSTFLPYIKLVYFPEPLQEESDTMNRLHMLSLQTTLLSLQNMLGRNNHKEVLLRESLEDFITCMPVYLPSALRGQAEELVRVVGSGSLQLQPPSLVNLVKAKLAKLHFGLVRVVSMSVGEIINEVMPST